MTTIATPAADLGDSAVCTTCGRPYLKKNGHVCTGPRSFLLLLISARYVAEVTSLRAEIAALDRGLVETAALANDAMGAAADLKRWRDKQKKAWEEFNRGKTSIEQAREEQQRTEFSTARRSRSRARSARPVAPSSHLSLVAPGGAA